MARNRRVSTHDPDHVRFVMDATGLSRERAERLIEEAAALQGVSDDDIKQAAAVATANGETFDAAQLMRDMSGRSRRAKGRTSEPGLVSIRHVPLSSITPSDINDDVYRPPSEDDPDIIAMADSMRERGVLQPLTITRDGFILSGHRRYCAATVAGLETVPVVVEDITRDDPAFPRLLVMHNQQRQKSIAELLAEQVVQQSGEDAHRELVQHRIARSNKATCRAVTMSVGEKRSRSEITWEKQPMLDAVLKIVDDLREFWPLSLRTIHYNLLNHPPLRNARLGTRYENNRACSSDLSDLCTRARLEGLLPFDAIDDETRPVTEYNIHRGAGDYIRQQMRGFLRVYWRDLLQSQPDHIEVIGEKNTLQPIIKPVCSEYTVPLTSGRGYCSLPPRKGIYDRWRESGKNKLVLIVLSDHDPDGEMIADSFVRSMRDDFKVPANRIVPIRAALTSEQCKRLGILSCPP